MPPSTSFRTLARPALAARRRGHRRPVGRAVAAVLALLAPFLLAACGTAFDPTGPCTTDGSAAGAYPDLEALVPTRYNGTAPAELDSGRACTAAGLGTLATHGVKELRFAGATWSTGTQSGVSLAIFTTADGTTLDPAWMAEFYEAGARAGKNVLEVNVRTLEVSPSIQASRLDVRNDESYQTVAVWQGSGHVEVAVIADFIREIQTKDAHDKIVRAAVDAFGR